MAHVGENNFRTEMSSHVAQFLRAFFVGGDLRFQIGDILIRAAGRVGTGGKQSPQCLFLENASFHQ